MKPEQVKKITSQTGVLFLLLTNFTFGQTSQSNPLTSGLKSTYSSVIQELFIIDQDDQAGRNQSDEVGNKYGWASKEYRDLWTSIRFKDSINVIKVDRILKTYGWLGADEIGSQSNTTLFMVLQHSNLKTQEKYLPLMRKAVTNGKAQPKHLALLEDRVALRQGKKQIYGSQVSMNNQTNEAFVMPLEDPDNVDIRRGLVGLPPLAEYVSVWGIKWDVKQYKKDLPFIEEKLKKH